MIWNYINVEQIRTIEINIEFLLRAMFQKQFKTLNASLEVFKKRIISQISDLIC